TQWYRCRGLHNRSSNALESAHGCVCRDVLQYVLVLCISALVDITSPIPPLPLLALYSVLKKHAFSVLRVALDKPYATSHNRGILAYEVLAVLFSRQLIPLRVLYSSFSWRLTPRYRQ